jgi:hypothetical protein
VLVAVFFARSAHGQETWRVGKVVQVLDAWMGAGFRVRGDEEVGATGTHFGVLAAGFFAHSAHGRVTSRTGDGVQVLDARMGPDFELGVMRRRYGRRAPILACSRPVFCAFASQMGDVDAGRRRSGTGWVDGSVFRGGEEVVLVLRTWFPSPSPALPAAFSPFPCLSPSPLPFLHPLPSTCRGVDRSRGCADVGGTTTNKKSTWLVPPEKITTNTKKTHKVLLRRAKN